MKQTLVLFVLLVAAPAAAQRDAREVASEVHGRGGYADGIQFESRRGGFESFPNLGGGRGASDAPRGARLGGGDGSLEGRRVSDGATGQAQDTSMGGMFGAASQLISNVLLAIVIVALVVLVGFLVAALLQRRNAPPEEAPPLRSPRRPMSGPEDLPLDLGDPDALAAQGRYGDAILALLVLALKSAGWKPEGQRSRTAREVLWSLAASDPRHPPLSTVVKRAERVRFAGDEATQALFEEVRDGYRALRRVVGGPS
ncbi:MAG: hypothetical protein H6721_19440 [Sandaracinus sp.]|nr:hypothetical protein [Sandaracinus sp.]MCB9624348.1 hypothetical protein [Sandaracinus sp.]MCB9634304.1 hypothetical protein [Sandaracinus sp.]